MKQGQDAPAHPLLMTTEQVRMMIVMNRRVTINEVEMIHSLKHWFKLELCVNKVPEGTLEIKVFQK
jgi:hypothetical protein